MKEGGYSVDLLITVDAAYGVFSGFLDREISDNVKINVNEYQNTNSPIGSRGDKNTGTSSTKIFNIKLEGVTHGNIDEATADYNIGLIKTMFSGKKHEGKINVVNSSSSSSRSSSESSSGSSYGSSSSSSFNEK